MRTPEPSTTRLVALSILALLAVILGANALAMSSPAPMPLPRGDLSLRPREPVFFAFD